MNRWLRVLFVLCFGTVLAFAWRAAPAGLTRGPFLQDLTPTEVSVVFKSSTTMAPVVRYGTTYGAPWQFEKAGTSGTTHVIRLTALKPETRYYYEIASGSSVIASDEELYTFRTAPPEKSRAPFRFVAFGDCGVGTTTQYDVSNQMAKLSPEPELALGLGDLVYESGAAADFDPKLFKPNEKLFPRVAFWPTIGNHEANTSNGAPFYEAFYLPTDTGAPGNPSNSERYYSFDHGMAHFVCIDSETSSMSPGSAMYEWAVKDIDDAKARGKRWIFAFMHHPPYSRGTHGDDTEVKNNLVPMFEAKGVDMLLAGHSHVYERSFLAKGNAPIQTDDDTYTKIGTPNGTIYLVSGCSGKTGSGTLDHQIMATSYGNVAGFSAIDVSYDEIHGYFIQKDGKTTDVFTVRKANDAKSPRITGAEAISATDVVVSFDGPVEAGSGTSGAANAANYLLAGGASVVSATLDADEHRVFLKTTSLTANKSYELSILRVKDASGNAIDARAIVVLDGGGGGGGGPVPTGPGVPEGATWRYFKGTSAPPANWTAKSFVDTSWAQGRAGIGFADSDDATVLSDMLNGYLTVYARTTFTVDDPTRITGMDLRVLYDDGFVAFVNGTEVARANMPAGQTNTTAASASHEADAFETFDIDAFKSALTPGTNVLAVIGANNTLSSSDFTLHPALILLDAGSGGGGGSTSVGPPVAHMDVDVLTANVPARIDFSSEGSVDDGSIVSRRWHFGDGTASVEAASTQHLFDREGIYLVTLIVKDNSGLESVDQKAVRVHAQGSSPVANLTANDNTVDAGVNVQFGSSGSQDPDGGPVYILWDFDDPASGVSNHATTATASHRFATQGTYQVTLSITDDEGSTDTQVSQIVVGAGSVPAPTPAFSVDVTSGQAPLLVHFTDQTTGDVTSWLWDFGDGSTSSQQNPTHTYNQTGSFTVRLDATGPGGSDSTSQVDLIEVVAAGQVAADFQVSRSGLQVTFSDDSTGDVTSWAWDFGDGATSTVQQPVHTYAAEGDYLVTLTVTGPNGTDAKQRLVEVTEGGGTGGGSCYGAIGEGPGPKGDPSLLLMIALVLGLLALQRRASRRPEEAISYRT